jgi:uncharacterized protein (TIGR02246 family)
MTKFSLLFILFVWIPSTVCAQTPSDTAAVKKTLESWNQGWAKKDADLALQDYAVDIDWTNAFGDRFKGRDALKKGLEFIFSLDFVMAGSSGDHAFEDVTFLTPDVALLRSKLVRRGQKTSTGQMMTDRHIHHLRVLHRRNGEWKIVSHLISQSHKKGGNSASLTSKELSGIWRGEKNGLTIEVIFRGAEFRGTKNDADWGIRDKSGSIFATLKRVDDKNSGFVHLRLNTASNPSGTVVGYLRRGDDESLKITVLPAASDIEPQYKPVAGFAIHKVKEMKLFAK